MIDKDAWVSPLAIVEDGVSIGAGSKVWEFAKIRSGAVIGASVTIGQGVYVGPGVQIGDNSKIQNYAQIFEPAILESGVFVGPGAILTNDKSPRAVNSDGTFKTLSDWVPVRVHVKAGASIGAGAICVAPVIIEEYAMVAAGAVAVKNVPTNSTVLGVPARTREPKFL
jgi:UDP-2-acetamido-3-amino-2,3-dideoxy-glucuronate N-acetyltransferase